MTDDLLQSLEGLPYYVAYFGSALVLYVIFLWAHVALVPTAEFRLLREGNAAAALSLAGAMLGYALPLASILHASSSMLDLLAWTAVALGVQLLTLVVLRRMLPVLNRQVMEGRLAGGVFVAALAVAVGLINAASVVL
jgi:putative membrane protein